MLFLFGTRASEIKNKRVDGNAECPYCHQKNTFMAAVFGRYFHLFWIPMFPLSKTTVLECAHCKKSYTPEQLPPDIKQVLDKSNKLDPPKRPLWHGCGCLIIAAAILLIVLISIASAIFYANTDQKVETDARAQQLQSDLEKASTNPDSTVDSISYHLKTCMDYTIEGVNTDKIQYYSKVDQNKVLILLKVNDLKNTEKSSRKELVFAVEDCLNEFWETEDYRVYIGVRGKWNMVLVKTPEGENLGGKFASSNLLLPFYGATPNNYSN